jgi:hypothetical protein
MGDSRHPTPRVPRNFSKKFVVHPLSFRAYNSPAMPLHKILQGDAIEQLKTLPDASINCVLADLPYGTTQCSWDVLVPFVPLWTQLLRVARLDAAFVFTACQPFTSALVMSRADLFKYSWHWDKVNGIRNHLNAKRQPMRKMEDVLVFYRKQPVYNPQMREGGYTSRKTKPGQSAGFGKVSGIDVGRVVTELYPVDLISIPNHDPNNVVHPTQKPVDLMRYLTRTYTNPGEIVLDPTMGSGTTGVACMQENRHFVGIELNPDYCEIARRRIAETS